MTTPDQMFTFRLPLLRLAVRAGEAIMEVYESSDIELEHKADASPLTLADRRAHDIIVAGLAEIAPSIPILSEEGRHAPYAERAGWDELWLVDPLDGTKEFVKHNGEFTVNIALVHHGAPVMGVIYAPVLQTAWVGIDAGNPSAWKLTDVTMASFEQHVGPDSDPDSQPITAFDAIAQPIAVRLHDPRRIAIIASRTHLNEETKAFIDRVAAGFDDVEIINVGSSLKLCAVADGRADLYPRYAPTSEWDTAAGHAIVRAAGGEIYQAGPDADAGTDGVVLVTAHADAGHTPYPLRYNKENLLNPWFVVRAWGP